MRFERRGEVGVTRIGFFSNRRILSTIVPSGDFPPGRARYLMKEFPRGNVKNHRGPLRERRGRGRGAAFLGPRGTAG